MTLLAVVHIVLTLSVCFSVRCLSFSVLLCPPNPINKYNKTRQRQGYNKTKYSLSRKIVRRLSKAFCLLFYLESNATILTCCTKGEFWRRSKRLTS